MLQNQRQSKPVNKQKTKDLVIPCQPNTFCRPVLNTQNDPSGTIEKKRKREETNDYIDENEEEDDDNVFERGMVDADHEYIEHSIPINQIGKALLRGMGWEEGKPFGRSNKIIEPIEARVMPKLAGLGSTVEPYKQPEEKKFTKTEEKRSVKTEEKSPYLSANTAVEDKRVFANNEEPLLTKEKQKRRKITWVIPNILVRIISKSFEGGKYYKTKGIVVDIPDMYTCSVRVPISSDRFKVLEGISESMLETVIPRELNATVICVAGKNKGKRGRMIDRDRKRQRCSFQITDEDDLDYGQIISADFDEVCEYVELNRGI
jgi:hypothetical protein